MSACERSTTGMENILGHCTDEGARRTKAHIPQARTQKESGTKYTREEEKGGGRRIEEEETVDNGSDLL